MPKRDRYVVFIAVAGAHAAALALLVSGSRAIGLSSWTGTPLTAVLLRRAAQPRVPIARPRLEQVLRPVAPLVEPITAIPPQPLLQGSSGSAVDWDAAAKEAAATVLQRRKHLSFGFPAGGRGAITLGVPSPHTPAHYAGESERTATGEQIEWTSDRCYVVSEPPALAEPDFLRNARLTHFGCLPPDEPAPGELFKSLPAYRRHLPQ